jgi:hypothetical protein
VGTEFIKIPSRVNPYTDDGLGGIRSIPRPRGEEDDGVGLGFVGVGRAHVLGVCACARVGGRARADAWALVRARRGHGGELVGTGVGTPARRGSRLAAGWSRPRVDVDLPVLFA